MGEDLLLMRLLAKYLSSDAALNAIDTRNDGEGRALKSSG